MDYNSLFKEWRDESMKAWSKMAPPTVTPDTFIQAMSASADFFMAGQKKMREATVQAMEASEVPTHKDFARLTKQVELAEGRATECEARVTEAAAANARLEQQLQTASHAMDDAGRAIAELEKRIQAVASR